MGVKVKKKNSFETNFCGRSLVKMVFIMAKCRHAPNGGLRRREVVVALDVQFEERGRKSLLCTCSVHCVCTRQLEVCLAEANRADLFVGLLGNRYGHVVQDYTLPDEPHFNWVRFALLLY